MTDVFIKQPLALPGSASQETLTKNEGKTRDKQKTSQDRKRLPRGVKLLQPKDYKFCQILSISIIILFLVLPQFKLIFASI